jgi:hypothetical protein
MWIVNMTFEQFLEEKTCGAFDMNESRLRSEDPAR